MNTSREFILTRLGLSPDPVSGDALAAELGLSRTGVWKHIQALRKSGADIQASPGQGYLLKSEAFTAGMLSSKLATRCIGKRIILLDETGSTNRDAMQHAEDGAKEGLVIVANRQSAGKGRMGRIWHTLPESLACSVLLRPDLPPEQVPQLSLLTAVALHDALSRFVPDISIKWPNDLLHRGAKLAGILTEMRAEPGRVHAVVLGFGINLNPPADGWPEDITQQVIDLETVACRKISRLDVATAVIQALDHWYALYLEKGFAPVHKAWWQAHAASGQKVRVHDGKSYIYGLATALDDDGALLLDTGSEIRRIIAGDLELL
ncbi:BirA family transcriptional regulator, biotin operon repressor / biotin-[acetyl-CoA-carboxylase] ligase [Mariprofundus micogutta]|uniref:Bifunctional ligase/repressor BirA n=1 Tax=Mariprofundus micogutta TaxID=1921010 RepID=A0A1L8CK87_9PROT|nr:biotin--[acetyl-CoA-carboxylase] ligase [Mariprofundus micogutta]GAV19279.1 BirA family transcriptional regulator, biotin operon repressor / biotin-[acetyl-CoA-carboxylase] ligase [Mariprofundus micogutta]